MVHRRNSNEAAKKSGWLKLSAQKWMKKGLFSVVPKWKQLNVWISWLTWSGYSIKWGDCRDSSTWMSLSPTNHLLSPWDMQVFAWYSCSLTKTLKIPPFRWYLGGNMGELPCRCVSLPEGRLENKQIVMIYIKPKTPKWIWKIHSAPLMIHYSYEWSIRFIPDRWRLPTTFETVT